ncbi:unnamed protein product [Auanema sp. JU1783]|nr:unnamed protein product [Auanema sp. JU1783]
MTAINGNISSHDFTAITDPSKQAQVYQYLEALKNDEFGWKKSAENIVTNNLSNVEEHFLLLQVVEDYLNRRYACQANEDAVLCVRGFLSHWIQKITSNVELPVFLINKMAHIFSLVFAADFPERWPNFMDDIFLCRSLTSVPFVSFYLKTLLAIDAEVVDRDIQRPKQTFDRNTKIKDFMREICIKQMVQSCWKIMDEVNDISVQCLCLQVISAYVDWIDVELVANDIFVSKVISRLNNKDTTDAAVSAVSALMQKGMAADKKLSLVLALSNVLRSNQLISVSYNSDEDDISRAGSLLNTIGMVLMDCSSKFTSEGAVEDAGRCIKALEIDLDTYLKIFDNEDIDLSDCVIDSLRNYVHLIRDSDDEKSGSFLSKVVNICLNRYTMSSDLEVDGEGEDELEFHEYRKDLKSIMNTIGSKRPQLIILPLEEVVTDAVKNPSSLSVHRLEAIMQLVYALSELIPSNFVQAKDGWLGRAVKIPLILLSGQILDGRSPVIHTLFFEIACRYERILANHLNSVPPIAAAFLDARGIAIPVAKARTRIVYLFCRFVKAHKTALSSLVSEVIGRLAPLLAVSPQSEFLSADDQCFIYEATATLIMFGDLSTEQKADYIRELASNLVNKFQAAVTELQSARSRNDEPSENLITQFMKNIIGYCSRMSKAFYGNFTMKSCGCVEIYLQLLDLFLEHLTPENSFLLENVRQLAHRLVVCLDEEVLNILPIIFTKLGSVSNDLDSMNHFLILAHQVLAKHKGKLVSTGLDLAAILTTAARYSVSDSQAFGKDSDESVQRNIVYVQRAFLQLLCTATTNDMLGKIAQPSVKNALLNAAVQLALGNDQSSQKLALTTLAKASQSDSDCWQQTLRTALQVPSLPHISPSDAGSTLVVHEVVTTLLALKQIDEENLQLGIRSLLPEAMSGRLLMLLNQNKQKDIVRGMMEIYASLKTSQ